MEQAKFACDKSECSSLTLDFYVFECVCGVIEKERRDIATVDLPGLFLQKDRDGEDLTLLKLTGAISLLLVESDESKWRKYLVRESG